jgi:hypothetical protein
VAHVRAGQLDRVKLATYTTIEPNVVCGIRGSESVEGRSGENEGEEQVEKEKTSSQGRRRCEGEVETKGRR